MKIRHERGCGMGLIQAALCAPPLDLLSRSPNGKADKAFRYFAACLSESEASQLSTDGGSEGECSTTSVDCVFAGKRSHYCEDKHMIKLEQRGEVAYQWVKGEPWAEVSTPGLFGA